MSTANNAIGVGSLILTANADPLTRKLHELEGKIHAWGKVARDKARAGAGKEGLLGGLFDTAKKLPAFTAGALGAAAGVYGLSKAIDDVHDVARQGVIAQALGLTSEQFTGLAGVAKSVGSDTKDFIEGLATLSGKAMDAAAGKGEESVAIFRALNLNAAEFTKLNMEDQFYGLMTALQQVANPAERFNLLMKSTGEDTGKNLLGLLAKSPSELRKMADGFAVNTEQMTRATAASQSLMRAQTLLQQRLRNVAIVVAPAFEFLAGELNVVTDSFSRVGKAGESSLEKIIRMTAELVDVTKAASGAMLVAAGLRLKYLQAEIVARSTLKGVEMGGAKGGGLGMTAGLALAAALEASEIGPTIREAGSTMLDFGYQMLKDVGKSKERADEFLKNLKNRKEPAAPGKGGFGWLDPIFSAKPPPAALPVVAAGKAYPEAVLRGSREAYSLELRNRLGAAAKAENKAIDEAKKTNKNLEKAQRKADQGNKHLAAIERRLDDIGVF